MEGISRLLFTLFFHRVPVEVVVELVAPGNESFKQIIRTFKNNYKTILGYFKRRSTNASAESFNAKIKMFRTQLRGICDPAFFIFRLQKLFA